MQYKHLYLIEMECSYCTLYGTISSGNTFVYIVKHYVINYMNIGV